MAVFKLHKIYGAGRFRNLVHTAHAGMTLRSTVTAMAADEKRRARTTENFILTKSTDDLML